MTWELVVNGELLREGELERVLNNLKNGESLIAEFQGHKFKVTKIENSSWCSKMWRIDLILPNGKEVFIINALYWFDVPYEISRLKFGDGWVKHYGVGNHPLDEFKWKLDAKLTKIIEGVYRFSGNHPHFSGAFRYIIWDEQLAKDIQKRLEEEFKLNNNGKVVFEDRATEYSILLVATTYDTSIEIGLHHTHPDGDFYVDEYNGNSRGYRVFKTFDDVINYITKKYGENNLMEFKSKAVRLQKEMHDDPYVIRWKGLK